MSSRVALIVALVAACGGSPANQPPEQPEAQPAPAASTDDETASKLGAARTAVAEKRWNDALVIVDEILAVDPDNEEAKRIGASAIEARQAASEEPADPVDEADALGEPGGVEGGVLGGVEGDMGAPPPPPPPPSQAMVVPVQALEAQRVAGNKTLLPPDDVKLAIQRDGKAKVIAVVKMCVGASGAVDSLQLIKASGYADYDKAILAGMQGWKYRPFTVNGRAVPVCSAVTFIYSQKS